MPAGTAPTSGIGRCAHCGGRLSGSRTGNTRTGLTQHYYRDPGETNGSCPGPSWSVPVKDLDAFVRDSIRERLHGDSFRQTLVDMLRLRLSPTTLSPVESKLKKLGEVEQRIERLIDMASNMTSGSGALGVRLERLESEAPELRLQTTGVDVDGPRVADPEIVRLTEAILQKTAMAIPVEGDFLAEVIPYFIKTPRSRQPSGDNLGWLVRRS